MEENKPPVNGKMEAVLTQAAKVTARKAAIESKYYSLADALRSETGVQPNDVPAQWAAVHHLFANAKELLTQYKKETDPTKLAELEQHLQAIESSLDADGAIAAKVKEAASKFRDERAAAAPVAPEAAAPVVAEAPAPEEPALPASEVHETKLEDIVGTEGDGAPVAPEGSADDKDGSGHAMRVNALRDAVQATVQGVEQLNSANNVQPPETFDATKDRVDSHVGSPTFVPPKIEVKLPAPEAAKDVASAAKPQVEGKPVTDADRVAATWRNDWHEKAVQDLHDKFGDSENIPPELLAEFDKLLTSDAPIEELGNSYREFGQKVQNAQPTKEATPVNAVPRESRPVTDADRAAATWKNDWHEKAVQELRDKFGDSDKIPPELIANLDKLVKSDAPLDEFGTNYRDFGERVQKFEAKPQVAPAAAPEKKPEPPPAAPGVVVPKQEGPLGAEPGPEGKKERAENLHRTSPRAIVGGTNERRKLAQRLRRLFARWLKGTES